jgi:hypothetical protein
MTGWLAGTDIEKQGKRSHGEVWRGERACPGLCTPSSGVEGAKPLLNTTFSHCYNTRKIKGGNFAKLSKKYPLLPMMKTGGKLGYLGLVSP